MKYINTQINSEEAAAQLVCNSENAFSISLNQAVDKAIRRHVSEPGNGIKIITLSGPTCSGKTTTADRLIQRIANVGFHAVVFSIDDFFLDRERTNDVSAEKPDYDSVKALDLEQFDQCVQALRAGRTAFVPHYDFTTGKRDRYTEYNPSERDIYIFEGIQAVYPEVAGILGKNQKSIFIHVAEDVQTERVVLSRYEIRLLRRLVRDYRFRNALPEFTLFLWETVRKNEDANIYPYANQCDVYIDSFLPYEPFILAGDVLPLLQDIPKNSPHRAEADVLAEKLQYFNNTCFHESMIPEKSVFREFIG